MSRIVRIFKHCFKWHLVIIATVAAWEAVLALFRTDTTVEVTIILGVLFYTGCLFFFMIFSCAAALHTAADKDFKFFSKKIWPHFLALNFLILICKLVGYFLWTINTTN